MTDAFSAARSDESVEPAPASCRATGRPRQTAPTVGFDTLIHSVRDDLLRYAIWLCGHPAMADDAVQEALVRAWRNWRDLKDRKALKPWLLTIVRREVARQYQRRRPDTCDIRELACADELSIATHDDIEIEQIREAIFRLQIEYREPLVLQVLIGLSANEIADIMGMKRGAVLTRLCRARRKLAGVLGNDQTEEGS